MSKRPYLIIGIVVLMVICVSSAMYFISPTMLPDTSKSSENITAKIVSKQIDKPLEKQGFYLYNITTTNGSYVTFYQIASVLTVNKTYTLTVYPQKNNKGYESSDRFIWKVQMEE